MPDVPEIPDLIAFVDSDLIDPDPRYVPRLLGPMLFHPEVHLVKAYYRRPLRVFKQGEDPTGGGRVTELVARPILAALRPSLRAILQPLGGEYAGTREFLASVPFAPGYGVEIGLLLDAESRYGLAGIAQVNLSVRKHRNRDLRDLGFHRATDLVGGFRAYAQAGLPVDEEPTRYVD